MANSLRAKLSKLRHDGHITDAEYQAFIKKMEGHDMEIYGLGYNQGSIDRAEELQKCREYGYNKAIDEFVERIKAWCSVPFVGCECIMLSTQELEKIAEQMKGCAE